MCFLVFSLSAHVTDASQCFQVADLLLRILGLRRNLGVDTEVDLLTSVRNMVDKIQQPLQLLPYVQLLTLVVTNHNQVNVENIKEVVW